MTEDMVWALREKHDKGSTIYEMERTYGIPRRVIAAAVGESCRDKEYWPCADLWKVREMLRDGFDTYEIADEFGVSHKTLANVITRNRDLFVALDGSW